MSKNLTNFLENYEKSNMLRMHMPGHKGKSFLKKLSPAYAWDITEIAGADSLFESDSILKQAEQQTANIYQVPATCWSAGGSTLCIQAMLAQMKAENRVIISARTVHRAFLNSCILLDLPVRWVFSVSGGIIGGKYILQDFEKALQEVNKPACIYITSPDYLGNLQDIAGLAEICKKYQAKLLVDNAHGAHLAFLKQNQHPIALGADMCCDSAHKTLPALTGGAFLHMKNPDNLNLLKQHMQMFGSTSPSYLIMQSLETCTEWLANQGKQAIQICAERAEQLKQKLAEKYSIIGNDSMHLTLQVNGVIMADIFRKKYKIECEYADKTCLVFLLSPMMTQEDFARLEFACMNCEIIPAEPIPELPLPLEQVYSMRESALAPWELINLEQAEGRICAPVQVPCPPAVPIVISGERLNKNWLNIMKFYDLEKIAVMQK